MSKKICDIVRQLTLPIANQFGLEIYDVEFVKEARQFYLRVFIDSVGGQINISDCENVSRQLSKVLDEVDPIEQDYILEVSSPGIERTLKSDEHFNRYIGYTVKITLYKPFDNKTKSKFLLGKLVGFDDKYLNLQVDDETLSLSRDIISSCKLYYDYQEAVLNE